jgi:hypothetical protein
LLAPDGCDHGADETDNIARRKSAALSEACSAAAWHLSG